MSHEDFEAVALTLTKEQLVFALSWALAAMDDDYLTLMAEDTDPTNPGEDAEQAREILRQVYVQLGGNDES
jgi:hypothetical protein